MTQRNENTDAHSFDLEDTTTEIAALTAPQESVDRVLTGVLVRTGSAADQKLPISRRASPHRTLAGGIALLSAVLVLGVLVMNILLSGIAFAQAQQQLEKTRSVQYVEFMHQEEAMRDLKHAENTLLELKATAMEAKGPKVDRAQLQKQFQEQETKLRDYIQQLNTRLEKGEPIELRRVWILGRSLHRSEQTAYGSKSVHITDAETGESVSLRPDLKECVLMKTQTALNMQSGEKTVTSLGPNPARNFYSQFAEIPSDGVTSLGQRQIEGKTTVGFEQTDVLDGTLIRRTYWVDPETKLPIRFEVVASRGDIVIGGSTITNIVFDQKLDPGLFSTAPPEGYTVSEGGFMSLDPWPQKE